MYTEKVTINNEKKQNKLNSFFHQHS